VSALTLDCDTGVEDRDCTLGKTIYTAERQVSLQEASMQHVS